LQHIIKTLFFCCLFITTRSVFAQPGGGGGLHIKGFYTEKGEKIDIFKSNGLVLRSFVVEKEKMQYETFVLERLLETEKAAFAQAEMYRKEKNPAYIHRPSPFYLSNNYNVSDDQATEQRLYIKYKNTEMIVDFAEILGENGMGNVDEMDSLIVVKGHFKWDRNAHIKALNQGKTTKKGGGTHNSRGMRISNAFFTLEKAVNTDFLQPKNLPSSYFYGRAAFFLENKNPQAALEDIATSIQCNNGEKNCETAYLLCKVYTQLQRYNEAIANITDAMQCSRGKYNERNWATRIDLYKKNKQYQNALADYDAMIKASDDPFFDIMERTYFKIDYMNDYAGAANDMRTVLAEIGEEDEARGAFNPQDYYGFSQPYFALARAEYGEGKLQNAFTNFLRAMECGYARNGSDTATVNRLTRILQYHNAPEIWVARGLAYYGRAPYEGWGDVTKASFAAAIADFDRAEQLGFNDYRINLYRAEALNQSKKYTEALQDIEIAIAKNPQEPRCYGTRYDIRRNLGQTKWGDKTDPDIVKQAELRKQ
jgi:Anaphase-promoting complex, cyclosome, subunit 3